MKRFKNIVSIPAFLAVAALVIALLQQSSEARQPAAAKPTVVVTVDLSAVISGLNQRADAETKLKRLTDEVEVKRAEYDANAKKFEEQLIALNTEIKDAAEAGQDVTRPEATRTSVAEVATQAKLKHENWLRFMMNKLDIERSLLLRELYLNIKQEIADLASAAGYDLVLVDDSQGGIGVSADSQLSREAQVRQQMITRRILYANEALDITGEVIARMNNAWAGAGGQPAANAGN